MWTGQGYHPADCPLSVVIRDSTGGSRHSGSRFVPVRKCLSRAPDFGGFPVLPQIPDQQIHIVERKRFSTAPVSGVIPGRLRISDCIQSCEEELHVPRHERALLRLANPVGGA
jgi:hypothetical protein